LSDLVLDAPYDRIVFEAIFRARLNKNRWTEQYCAGVFFRSFLWITGLKAAARYEINKIAKKGR
jgi:hypothetical protein